MTPARHVDNALIVDARVGWEFKNNSSLPFNSSKLTVFAKNLFDERYLTYISNPSGGVRTGGVGNFATGRRAVGGEVLSREKLLDIKRVKSGNESVERQPRRSRWTRSIAAYADLRYRFLRRNSCGPMSSPIARAIGDGRMIGIRATGRL